MVDIQKKLEMIPKWLKDSGLTVNESKTQLCLFHRNETQIVKINLNGDLIISKNLFGILSIIFGPKLNF
jgi:uncharacterized protein YjiK